MAFPAKYRTSNPCKVCGKYIEPGEMMVWSRRNRGVFYHAECFRHQCAGEFPRPFTPQHEETSVKPAQKPKPEFKSEVHPNLRKNASWYEIFEAILPASNRILLIGPPSSGKSTTAILTAKIAHRLTMTETTSREDLIGMFHLIDGATKWVDGPVTVAMRNGEAVLIDEIDRYSPECASLLYSVIDDKPHLSLPNGEFVEAKDGYKVIMTSNEGIETLPVAVQDRIEIIIFASTPHKDALTDVPNAAQEVVMRYYTSQPQRDLRLPPTVRRMKAFFQLINFGIPNEIAATIVFGKNGSSEVLSVLTSAEGNSNGI